MTTTRSLRTLLRCGAILALAVLFAMLLAGCRDDDAGLSRAEVEEIVRAEIAEAPTPPTPEPGLTSTEVEEAIRSAIAEIPRPEPGLTSTEVEEAIRSAIAEIPTPEPGLTAAEVEEVIRSAIAAIPRPVPGLTPAQIEEIVRQAIADVPQPEPGLTAAEVREMVEAAVAAIPTPQPGLTAADAERIARSAVASIPLRSAPAEYTMHFVDNAISRYETQGLDAALAHYNSPRSVDGQWYVFIVDGDGIVIGHPDPERRGLDLNGWVGTDANGYEFGPEMLSATEEGKWVSYVYRNPESGGIGPGALGDFELKNVWVERRDGLLFASGWYIDADAFTKRLVSIAVATFRDGGLAATVAYFASPGSALAGLEAAVAYYNAAETVDGRWFAFIGDPGGTVVAHSDPSMIGSDVDDLLGGAALEAREDGAWVESESQRVWVAGYDGFLFGSGWRRGATER